MRLRAHHHGPGALQRHAGVVQQAHHPAGVHGTLPGSPCIRRPMCSGASAVDVLVGWMRAAIARLGQLVGDRQLHQHAVDPVVGVEVVDHAVEFALGGLGG